MDSLVNSVKSVALNVGALMTPILKESKFTETGVLTPDEFVLAGDHLVHHCPTWAWYRAADSSRTKSYLPVDKQFLMTKNVPCYRRCRQMEYDPSLEKILGGDDFEEGFECEGEGWVDTHHFSTEMQQKVTEMDEASASSNNAKVATNSVRSASKNDDDDDDDDDDGPAMDMEEFIKGGRLEDDDPNAFVQSTKPTIVATTPNNIDNTIHTRTYDMHITYDKYYQVPRMWLIGYDEQRKPLSVDAMNEDFSQDHANKTITMETHPHLSCPQMASIHPCRHAEVMKRLIEQLAENGRQLGVHQYLLIFLKFVQAVIPTIEYDYTRSIQL